VLTGRAGAAETEVGEVWEGETGVQTGCGSAWDKGISSIITSLYAQFALFNNFVANESVRHQYLHSQESVG